MIQEVYGPDRAIIYGSPEVYYRGTDAKNLLKLLITLGRRIYDRRNEQFWTQKRVVRRMLQRLHSLVIFLKGIGEFKEPLFLKRDVNVFVWDLYATFELLDILVGECSNKNSRVWMLWKAELVCLGFESLTKGIAAILDEVSFCNLGLSKEMEKLGYMISKHASAADVSIDSEDFEALRDLRELMDSSQLQPMQDQHTRVLKYLHMGTWLDCYEQSSHLAFKSSHCHDQEMTSLAKIVSLLKFWRVTVFTDYTRVNDVYEFEDEVYQDLDPLLSCPISHELMSFPVTLVSSGITYDEYAIERYILSGNLFCPMSRKPIGDQGYVRNLILKRIIDMKHPRSKLPVTERIEKSLRMIVSTWTNCVVSFLISELLSSTVERQTKAAYEIWVLSMWSKHYRDKLAEAGAVVHLVKVLRTQNSVIQEERTVQALMILSQSSDAAKQIMDDGMQVLVDVFVRRGVSVSVREFAAKTVIILGQYSWCRELVSAKGSKAIPGLIEFFQAGEKRAKTTAAGAIATIIKFNGKGQINLLLGVVPLLIDMISLAPYKSSDMLFSLNILHHLAGTTEGAIILNNSYLPTVIRVVKGVLGESLDFWRASTSQYMRGLCIVLLGCLCEGSEFQDDLIRDEVHAAICKDADLMRLIISLTEDENNPLFDDASTLLRQLADFIINKEQREAE